MSGDGGWPKILETQPFSLERADDFTIQCFCRCILLASGSTKKHVSDRQPGSASSFLALSGGELIAWGRGVTSDASDSEEREIPAATAATLPGDIGTSVPGPLELRDFAVEVK